jgi:hypothetical protein
VIPQYTTTAADIVGADPQYVGLDSTLILGEQLPGRPVHTANLTVDALYAPARLEFLANAHYVGANNNQFIAPYTLVNVGVSHPLGIGKVTVFASNLFNTEAGVFSTEQYAQPIPLSGGSFLFQAARPNAPRQYQVTFSFNTGARPGAGFSRGARGTAQTGAAAGPAAGNPRAALGFGQLKFIPPPAGTDPLSLATSRTECTADLQAQAQPILAQLGVAAKAFGAGEPLPAVTGVVVTPHGDRTGTWWFGMGPDIPESALPQRPADAAGATRGPRGPGGPPGGPGGEGPGGPGGPPRVFQERVAVQSNPNAEPRAQFTPSPQLLAALQPFRALVSCSFGTVLTPAQAKAQGYDVPLPGVRQPRPSPAPGASPAPEPAAVAGASQVAGASPAPGASPGPRTRRFGGGNFVNYAPAIGIFVVRAPDLGTGGGSVKQ